MQSSMAVGTVGYAPEVKIGKARPSEKAIYETMWGRKDYRNVSPGEKLVASFLTVAKPKPGSEVIDLGCGTGRGGLMLATLGQLNVTMVDFASNCLDEDIRPMLETQKHVMRFVEADLTEEIPATAQYGFCTDVLEHIPTEDVDKVLDNCLHACQHVFFQIAMFEDAHGDAIGHRLHLTIKPYEWWLKKFIDRECTIHYAENLGHACVFYVSAWITGHQMVEKGVLNLAEKQGISNVKTNIEGGWKQIEPHITNDIEVMIVGGGPSLSAFESEIRRMQTEVVKIVTLNGAYEWCLERGIGPVTQIMVDGRAFNERFVARAETKDMFLIASQCDPSVFAKLNKERTYMWHTSAEMYKETLDRKFPEGWYGIPGGSTVLLRAIPLLRMLGYRKFHLFGCDSCVMDGVHHAYTQPEND